MVVFLPSLFAESKNFRELRGKHWKRGKWPWFPRSH